MRSNLKRASRAAAILAGILLLGGGAAHAQRIFSGFYGTTAPRFPTAHSFRGGFNFCRVMFASNRREKRGWGLPWR